MQYPFVIKNQRRWNGLRTENRDTGGVVLCPRFSPGLRDINQGCRVAPRIALRIGITAQQYLEGDMQRRFLFGFTHGRLFDGFTHVYKSPRQRPAEWRVFATDQYDRDIGAITEFDNDVCGK